MQIDYGMMFSVNRIQTSFLIDDLGNKHSGTGTGFWVLHQIGQESVPAFVTNRHNIDPEMLWPGKGYSLYECSIELRRYVEVPDPESAPGVTRGVTYKETTFAELTDLSTWKSHATADCAVVINPVFKPHPPEFRPLPFWSAHWDLATDFWIGANVQPMDHASFIGYAGTAGRGWWDQTWNLPIARPASLASEPAIPFTHDQIRSSDAGVVAGLSFTGSSGSPLVLHEKYVPRRKEIGLLRPSKIVGIMSGHMIDRDAPEMFRHTGLSYYTRASSIRELLGLER